MANKRLIVLKNNEALIKIDGAVGAQTIDLAVDLLGANEVISGTPTVNVIAVSWCGLPSGTFTIVRNGVTLFSGSQWGFLGLDGNTFDTSFNTSNIVVTTATSEVQVWIRVHKIAGYATKFEPDQFGSYDNPAAAGS